MSPLQRRCTRFWTTVGGWSCFHCLHQSTRSVSDIFHHQPSSNIASANPTSLLLMAMLSNFNKTGSPIPDGSVFMQLVASFLYIEERNWESGQCQTEICFIFRSTTTIGKLVAAWWEIEVVSWGSWDSQNLSLFNSFKCPNESPILLEDKIG